jgi:pimeloyl-ACP methyl ester carboxylesterase
MHAFYLHGFTSSAKSSKARFFSDRLAPFGVALHCPDFNEPDFSTLTVTRMIGQVTELMASLPPAPVVLVGSSLGAFVAWHVTARQAQSLASTHPIERLVLLAPALEFGASRMPELGGDGLRQWRETGWRDFFHYSYNEPRRVHYALYEDARQYVSAEARVTVPALVFQGSRDALVDPSMVRAFTQARPSMTLHELDDDHQLHGSLDVVWSRTAAFLGLAE